MRSNIGSVMNKGEIYIVFLIKVHAPSEVEEQSRTEAAISDNSQDGFTRSRMLTMKRQLHKRKTQGEKKNQ